MYSTTKSEPTEGKTKRHVARVSLQTALIYIIMQIHHHRWMTHLLSLVVETESNLLILSSAPVVPTLLLRMWISLISTQSSDKMIVSASLVTANPTQYSRYVAFGSHPILYIPFSFGRVPSELKCPASTRSRYHRCRPPASSS